MSVLGGGEGAGDWGPAASVLAVLAMMGMLLLLFICTELGKCWKQCRQGRSDQSSSTLNGNSSVAVIHDDDRDKINKMRRRLQIISASLATTKAVQPSVVQDTKTVVPSSFACDTADVSARQVGDEEDGLQVSASDEHVAESRIVLESVGWTMETCVICMEPYKQNDLISYSRTQKKCKHTFHTQCILLWLCKQDECPCCRRPLILE